LGELACDEWHQPARVAGTGWMEVVRDGAAVAHLTPEHLADAASRIEQLLRGEKKRKAHTEV